MSEELLRAIIRLFAIVAKERITDEERANIKEFLSVHLDQAATEYYLNLFENYVVQFEVDSRVDIENVDEETLEFVDEWRNIIKITQEVNKALTLPQKMVLITKIIELVFADGSISERQENLIYYIGDSLKISLKNLNTLKLFVTGEDYEELAHSDILIIDEATVEEFDYTGPHMTSKNLTGLIAILRIPETESYFIKYLGISLLYLNAIPLKSRMIDVFPTGSTLRGSKIQTIYYSDVINRFLAEEEHAMITFSAEHLFYHFRSGRAGIQNVNIAETGGKLIGLMGASGSGKSTLLSVLNGTEKPSGGRVIINGINIHEDPKEAEGLVGYVPQDDYLIGELTVFENLYYAARLSFKNNTEAENTDLVNQVLANLGLSETKNLKVGSPLSKTISGGQRKRINIGLELLREPAVLFVDEPTSGLSSRDSENIMDLLKELSFRGKMVFVVIHQPSSDIFKMFDSLLILDTGGFQIYYGNPVESITYFKKIINAANKSQSGCPECGNINPEQIFNIIETRVVNEFGRLTDVRKISPGQWYQYFRDHIKIPTIQHVKDKIKVTQSIPGHVTQSVIYFIRDVKAKLANRQYLAINLLEAPVLAIFMAFMVRYYDSVEVNNPVYSFAKNENIPVYFFMCIIVALFMGLTVSAEEIFRDRMVRKRERFLNLSRTSYLFSKIVVLFIISAIQTGTFVLIGDAILDINGVEPRIWLILFSTSCFANLMGLNISSGFDSAVTIYILIPLLLIPQLLLSGVVINFDKFNPKVSNMESVPLFGEMMASRWAFEASLVTQYKDNPYERMFYDIEQRIADASYMERYYIPKLETALSFCFNNLHNNNPDVKEKLESNFRLLTREITIEAKKFKLDIDEQVSSLSANTFNSGNYKALSEMLSTLKMIYVRRNEKAVNEKQQKINEMIEKLGSREAFDSLRFRYQNEAVGKAVKNEGISRIIRIGDKLIRKVDPIYLFDNQPEGLYNFRTGFYSPKKYFAGRYFDTLWFNLSIIWLMTLVLYLTLYYNVLRKLVGLTLTDKRKRMMRQLK